jgi:hypothetical protein
MDAPTFDSGGYPTEETLEAICGWDYHDFPALMEFVASAWQYGGLENKPSIIEPLFDSGYEDDGYWWCGATGGWSGNEDLVGALSENMMFAGMCWRASVWGGYYEYHVRPPEDAS